MKLMTTDESKVTVGFAEKDSPLFGYIKPIVQAAFTVAILYFSSDTFGKDEAVQAILVFMTAFGIESVNVAPRARR